MILCCGEALIDMLPRDLPDAGTAFVPFPGGAVFNTAVALGRLQAPSGFLSGLSEDLFGAMLEAHLTGSGVDASLCVRSDRPTTLAFVTLTDGQARYAFYDENTAGRMLSPEDLPTLSSDVSALFFGGISLMVEPCATAYEALLARDRADRAVMIDPNIRPGFIRDEPTYRARIERMIAMADIVKVSDEDLDWIVGAGEQAEQAARLKALGPSLLFVTQGADGVSAYGLGTELFHPAQPVRVVDTVGAGDTFNAGVLAALHGRGVLNKNALAQGLAEDAIIAACDLGVRAAAVTVSRAGANPPLLGDL